MPVTEWRISLLIRTVCCVLHKELSTVLLHSGLRTDLMVLEPVHRNCLRGPEGPALELRTRNWAAMERSLPVSEQQIK